MVFHFDFLPRSVSRPEIAFPELQVNAQVGLAFRAPDLLAGKAHRVDGLRSWVFGKGLFVLDRVEAVHAFNDAPLATDVARQAVVAKAAHVDRRHRVSWLEARSQTVRCRPELG